MPESLNREMSGACCWPRLAMRGTCDAWTAYIAMAADDRRTAMANMVYCRSAEGCGMASVIEPLEARVLLTGGIWAAGSLVRLLTVDDGAVLSVPAIRLLKNP